MQPVVWSSLWPAVIFQRLSYVVRSIFYWLMKIVFSIDYALFLNDKTESLYTPRKLGSNNYLNIGFMTLLIFLTAISSNYLRF